MSGDWDKDFAAVGVTKNAAQTNLNGVRAVSPEKAAEALRTAPTVGVPPAMAMHDPSTVKDMARSRGQTAIVNTSPAVKSWASGDPVKVAATQDDFPSLASIADNVSSWYNGTNEAINKIGQKKFRIPETGLFNLPSGIRNVGDPALILKNLTDPIASTFHALPRDVPLAARALATAVQPKSFSERWQDLKAGGRVLGEGLNLLPGFAAFTSAANAGYVQPVASIFDLLPPPHGETKEEQRQRNREMVSLSLFGLAAAGRPRGVIDEGNVTPQQLRITGPGEQITDAEFEPVPGYDPQLTVQHQDISKADVESVKKLQDEVKGSVTHTRSPELMEDYLNNHTPAGQAIVSVPPEAINKLWQDGYQAFGQFEREVAAGLSTGVEVRMPLGTYLAETAGKPFADELLGVTRFRENGVTQEEADALPEEDLAPMKEEIEGRPGVNVRRMAGMLGPQLYGDPEVTAQVTAKEVLQNSFDAIKSAMADNGLLKGKIHIKLDRGERRIIFHDNGVGMAPELLSGKFLQIAGSEKGENASGGFGIAKMLFLYGNNELHVQTLKDGVLSEMKTSGPALMDALEEGGTSPKIQTYKLAQHDEKAVEAATLFPEGHGTRISIQIPEHYTDQKTGEKNNIPFPYDVSDIPAIKNSPLFADIDVTESDRWGDEPKAVENIGSSFNAAGYTTFGNVKFPWGTARIYISKEPITNNWEAGVHILSNGLWQFTETLPANPNEMYGKKLPFNIFLDINPNVKPEQSGYPFGFNRQAFTESAAKDVAEVKKYIQATYGAKMLKDEASSFGTVRYLEHGKYSGDIELQPEVPQTTNAFDQLEEGDSVEVREGRLIINGKVLPELTPEELKKVVPKSDELLVDQSLIDPKRVMVHDNTEVGPEEPTGDFEDNPTLQTHMQRQFGKRFIDFEETVGEAIIHLKSEVSRVMGYAPLDKEAAGISYDIEYRGVSIKVPFSGMFINPLLAEGNTPLEKSYGIVGTIIHEFAHHKVRSHNDRFAAEMQRILYKLQADDQADFIFWQDEFVKHIAKEYSDIMEYGKELFDAGRVKNRGKSFEAPAYQSTGDGGDEGLSGELASARQGREGSGELSGRDGSGAETREGDQRPAGVPGQGEGGVGGNTGSDHVGTFVADVQGAVALVRKGIAQLEQELGLRKVVTDAKAVGMTAKQFKGYDERLRQWEKETEEKLVKKMVKQFYKEHGPDWKAAVQLHMEEAEKAIENLASVRAMRAVLDPDFKLSRADVAEVAPELVDRLPKGIFRKDGYDPQAIAELNGYETGKEMIDALAQLQTAIVNSGSKNLDGYVKMRASVYANEQARLMTGYDLSPEAVYQHVKEELDNPLIEDLMVEDLQAYADEHGLPLDKDGLKAFSVEAFERMRVKDALRTRSFAANVRRFGNKAEEGLMGEKADDAWVAKQKQFVNFSMIQQSLALTKDYAKTQKKFTRWAKRASNKNIDQEYMNYVHAELMAMGYNVKRDLEELTSQIGGKTLQDFLLEKEAVGKVIFYEPFPGQGLEHMTVKEYQAARDTLSSLVHNGRLEAGIVIMGRRSSFADLMERVREKGDALGRKITPEVSEAQLGVQKFASAVNAYMLKGEQLLDEMDINDPQGPLNQSVIYPLQEAKGRENDMLANITKQLKAFGKDQPKNWLGTMKVKINSELKWTNPATGLEEKVLTTRGKLVKLMLNLGNEVNLSKLLEGYDWDYGDVMAAVHAHATKADWDFVQKVWDLHEELWPEVVRVYRNLAGVAPKRRVPSAVQTPFGVYKGGYFPISYDKLRAPELRQMSADSIWGEDYASGLPANPYTKGVTAYVAPLDLTFEGLNKSLAQVIHDLAFREALSQSVRVLGHDVVRKAIQHNFGPSYTAQLRPWLEYIARERVFDDRSAGWLENFFSGLRSNITFVGLAYRRTSAVIHFEVALSDSVAEVGAVELGQAITDYLRNPKYWDDFIATNSPELRHRAMNMDQNIREAFIHLAEKQGFLDEAQKFGYHMLALSDMLSATPTWMAALKQEVAKGYSPAEAFQIADKRVRQAHGASHPVDVAAVQRGGQGFWAEVGKSSFGLFLSFMNHAYNRLWAISRRAGRAVDQAKAGEWAGASRDFSKVAAMTFGYVIMASLLVTASKTWFKTGNPIPKHFGDWVDGIAHTTFGGLPGVGTLIEAFEHKESESPLERAVTTNIKTAENAWNKITGHDSKVSKRWLQQGGEAVGYWTGKVPGAISKDAQYLWDVSTGAERPPKDLNEFMQVLVTGGRAKK